MENREIVYIKLNDNTIINENCIRWVRKMNECLQICTLSNGCKMKCHTDTICKKDNLNSYNKLNKHFEENHS
jgi:hypothetical protein